MSKSILPTFKKWTTDEKRLLALFLLLVIYPVFFSSFFALYFFLIMPAIVTQGVPRGRLVHIYWLAVTLLWVFLCLVILPCFQKKRLAEQVKVERSSLIPPVKVKVEDRKDDESNLSSKGSQNSTMDLKKTIDSESDKENSDKSYDSLNKMKLSQSGEFLNDFITSVESEDAKNETVCEVHVEARRETLNETQTAGRRESASDTESDRESGKYEERENKPKEDNDGERKNEDEHTHETTRGKHDERSGNTSQDSSDSRSSGGSDSEPTSTSPPQKSEPTLDEHQDTTLDPEVMEEIDQLEDNVTPYRRVKAVPAIDTSRASGYYECSMPTPRSLERQNSQSNTVFLFVTPGTADTQESIEVLHGKNLDVSGLKEEEEEEKTEP